MKRSSKITLALLLVLLVAGGVFAGYRWSRRDLVTVQTAVVERADLASIVTASGEIKPRNYINLGANAQGPITELLVKEGDRVRKGQIVARIENIQPRAEVQAQRAAVDSAIAEATGAEAAIRVQEQAIATAQATLEKAKSDTALAKSNFDRYEQLYKNQLIARQEYEQVSATLQSSEAAVRESAARLAQVQAQRGQFAAQLSGAQRRITQAQAVHTRVANVLAKFDVVAPIDGVVTNLPVRMGETVVPGIQNSPASTVMTIADMSLITAEVKADETDIVSVQVGQEATITIDAIPNRVFHGKVIEIGNTAILRSSGLAASQSATSSQEAKDFKVVVALDDPPAEIRPGLSCTAKITTAVRMNVLSIPIQALAVRRRADLEEDAAPQGKAANEELQGVFGVADQRAVFQPVATGITGPSEIEVTEGLKEGDEIVIGPYKTIRTMRNQARIVVDNKRRQMTETGN